MPKNAPKNFVFLFSCGRILASSDLSVDVVGKKNALCMSAWLTYILPSNGDDERCEEKQRNREVMDILLREAHLTRYDEYNSVLNRQEKRLLFQQALGCSARKNRRRQWRYVANRVEQKFSRGGRVATWEF